MYFKDWRDFNVVNPTNSHRNVCTCRCLPVGCHQQFSSGSFISWLVSFIVVDRIQIRLASTTEPSSRNPTSFPLIFEQMPYSSLQSAGLRRTPRASHAMAVGSCGGSTARFQPRSSWFSNQFCISRLVRRMWRTYLHATRAWGESRTCLLSLAVGVSTGRVATPRASPQRGESHHGRSHCGHFVGAWLELPFDGDTRSDGYSWRTSRLHECFVTRAGGPAGCGLMGCRPLFKAEKSRPSQDHPPFNCSVTAILLPATHKGSRHGPFGLEKSSILKYGISAAFDLFLAHGQYLVHPTAASIHSRCILSRLHSPSLGRVYSLVFWRTGDNRR